MTQIATPIMPPGAACVVRGGREFTHLTDVLHDEAVLVLHDAIGDVSGKRLDSAAVPGAGRHGISRALNGCTSNPLFRVAALFLLMKRLGLGRERAQRIVDWLQEVVDAIWPPNEGEEREAKEVLAEDQRLRLASEGAQTRLAWGEAGAAGEALEIARAQRALAPTVVHTLRRLAAAEGAQ